MKKLVCLLIASVWMHSVWASAQQLAMPSQERETASVPETPKKKRMYPGGADEDDLKVMAGLPEAMIKIDARSLQREVYKELYNEELKEDHGEEDVED